MNSLQEQVGGSHYKDMPYQPIELIAKLNLNFFQGNIVKYACRYKSKNGRQDLEKIVHYAKLAEELCGDSLSYIDPNEVSKFNKENALSGSQGAIVLYACMGMWEHIIRGCEGLIRKEYPNGEEPAKAVDGLMSLTEWCDTAHKAAKSKGFYEKEPEVGTALMLVVSELGEAVEAHRKKRFGAMFDTDTERACFVEEFDVHVKDTFEDELADAAIRLFDLCGWLGIDLDWYVRTKMDYNTTRPEKHGKSY